jgi:hypothetical protein
MAKPTLATVFTAQDFMSPQIKKMQDSVSKMSDKIGDLNKKSETTFNSIKKLLIGGLIYTGVKEIVNAAAETEKFQTVLQTTFTNSTDALSAGMTTVEYAAKKAQESMSMIQEFASKTPYQVNELTSSFIKLANRGILPSMDILTAFGDVAASQGKTFDQFTEAVLDATSGEFERLKEFGIKGKKERDKITLSFKNINQVVKNTPEEIQKAIIAFGKMEGVSGSMDNVSKTFSGMSSTLKDNINLIAINIGSTLLPHLNKLIQFLLDVTKEIGAWTEANKDLINQNIDTFILSLNKAIDILKIGMDTGLIPVIIGMKLAFEAAKLAILAQTAVTTAYTVVQSILDVGLIATTKLIIAQNAAWLASPIGLAIISVAALASAFYLLYKNIETIDGWILTLWTKFTEMNIVLKILIGYLALSGIVALIAFAPITATVVGVIIAIYALVKAYQYLKNKISGEPIETEIKEPELPTLPGIQRPEPIPGMEAIDRKNMQTANSGMLMNQTINRNNNSNVTVDFRNLPQNANITQKGQAPNININRGMNIDPFILFGGGFK